MQQVRKRLVSTIQSRSVVAGKEVTLASGQTSSFYVDLKKTTCLPEALRDLGHLIWNELRSSSVDLIGGPATGSIALCVSASLQSVGGNREPVPWFFVRKEEKSHGSRRRIEGEFSPGAAVMLIEDVTTTGGSILDAASVVSRQGADVRGVLTVVDRLEGARDSIEEAGYSFGCLFDRSDFEADESRSEELGA